MISLSFYKVDLDYGISWDDPPPLNDNVEVHVPDVQFHLSEDQQ